MVLGAVLRMPAVPAVASLVTWWGWVLIGVAAWFVVSVPVGLLIARLLSGRRR